MPINSGQQVDSSGIFDDVKKYAGVIADPVGVVGTIGAGLIGGGLDYLGAQKQNETAKEIADEQMAFQERMSNTAHQREIADLKASGLNPVLSANAGASSPSGAMAPVVNELSGVSKSLQNLPTELMGVASSVQNIRESESKTDYNKALADAVRGGLPAKTIGTDLYNSTKDLLKKLFSSFNHSASKVRDSGPKQPNFDNANYWTVGGK